jgi:hypothetical protein
VNPATVLALHAAYALVVFAASHRCFDHGTERLLRAIASVRGRFTGGRIHGRMVLPHLGRSVCGVVPRSDTRTRPHLVAFLALTVIVIATRVWPVLREARLLDPAGYQELFLVRRIIDTPWPGLTLGGAAWSAALATLSAVDPAYIARFLPALLACALTWVLPRVVLGISRRFDTAVLAAACWVVAGSGLAVESPWEPVLSRQYVVIGAYVASLFLLAMIADRREQNAPLGRGLLIALAVTVFSPSLGFVAAGALASPPHIRLGVVVSTWIAIAAAGLDGDAPAVLRDAATTLPLALALCAAMVSAALPRRIYLPERSSAVACGALVAVGGFTVLPLSHPVEHDELARQTLRIVRQTPGSRWTIVAGDVPLLGGHGGEHVMRIPVFIACSSGAPLPECVAAQQSTTYVIVQKHPFHASALADEQALLSAVERLVHATKGSHLDYEDRVLRVYVVPPQLWARP